MTPALPFPPPAPHCVAPQGITLFTSIDGGNVFNQACLPVAIKVGLCPQPACLPACLARLLPLWLPASLPTCLPR